MPRSLISTLMAAAALLAAPTAASAADTYVNGDGGTASDANDCTVITTPCLTIGQGLIQAGTGNTVHVDDSANITDYNESEVLDEGKSIVADDFDNSHTGSFTIRGTIGPTIKVSAGDTGGTVSGFVLAPAAAQETVFLEGPATFRDNQINNPNPGATALDISTPAGGTGTVIDHNSFNGDNTTANAAISISDGTPQIINNTISAPLNGFNLGIVVTNGSNPTIDGNHFQAIFESGGNLGFGVTVFDAHATITDNRMDQMGGGDVIGIAVQQNSVATGATVRRNQLFGAGAGDGMDVFETADPVILDSNLVVGFSIGIEADGSPGPTSSDGDTSVINATVVDNGQDVGIENTHVTLDSSIVEDPLSVTGAGNPGCTITFSRGPSLLPGACTQFQTTADPGFVDASGGVEANDYHLQPTSAMVEAGNPAVPGAGSLDLDAGPRSCDGNGDGALRRDIGADELRTPANDDCALPNTTAGKVKVKRAKRRAKRTAKVTFSSTDPGSSFECKLDAGSFKHCAATTVFRKLKLGKHTLAVRATDAFGNLDQTPATGKFRVRRPRRHHH